jgi:hypothetical protein
LREIRDAHTGLVFAIGAALALLPAGWLAVHAPQLVITVEAPNAVAALMIGVLATAQFRRHGRLGDLALGAAGVGAGLTGMSVLVLPDVTGLGEHAQARGRDVAQLLITAGVLGAALLAWAGLRSSPARRTRHTIQALVATAAFAIVAGQIHLHLAPGAESGSAGFRSGLLGFPTSGHVLEVLALMAAAALLCSTARRTEDPVLRWVALAGTLAAVARLHLTVAAAADSTLLTSSHLFSVLARATLLTALVVALRTDRAAEAAEAARAEQIRLSRQLHQGMGSLAFITAQARWLANNGRGPADPLRDLAEAAEHALNETRSAIRGRTDGTAQQHELGRRHGPGVPSLINEGWEP